MKLLPLVLRNALRSKVRTGLTVLSIAVALFLYGLLTIIDAAFQQGTSATPADRLMVRNRTSIIMPLPYSYGDKIARVPGVTSVTYASWFGGVYQDPRNFFMQFAIDKDTYFRVYADLLVQRDQMDAFLADREACIVGRKLQQRFGWKIGDRVPIRGTIYPGTWEFNIRGVYDPARPQDDSTVFMFRHDYLEERRRSTPSVTGSGVVGWYVVRVSDPEAAAGVARAIDGRFANSAHETLSEPEKLFMAGALAQMGNVRAMLLSVGAVVLFTLLLVTGTTMATAVRERTGELAVLKTLGFSDTALMALVLAESVAIALPGGAAGIGLAKLLTLGGDPTAGMLPVFHLSPWRAAVGLLGAVAVGFSAGIIPATLAMRLKVVDALRKVY